MASVPATLAAERCDPGTALRALAHPGRRRMVTLVCETERTSGELAQRCGCSKPAASQHLKVLREAQLVSVRVDGNRRLYRARADRLAELRSVLDEFWGDRLERLRAAVDDKERSR